MMEARRRKADTDTDDVVHIEEGSKCDDRRLILPEPAGDADCPKSESAAVSSPDISSEVAEQGGLKGDRLNVALLMLLCILNGILMGIPNAMPYFLQSRRVSYKQLAVFSFVLWPFSLKLLWAPLVDSIYLPAFGRRKSWLVPTQYLIGIFLFILSCSSPVHELTKPADNADSASSINMTLLTGMFFVLTFLAATQDIAVSGWALTMLSKYVVLSLLLIGQFYGRYLIYLRLSTGIHL